MPNFTLMCTIIQSYSPTSAEQSTTNSPRSPAEEQPGKPELVKKFRISLTMEGRFWAGTAPDLFSTAWAPAFGTGSCSATAAPSDTACKWICWETGEITCKGN